MLICQTWAENIILFFMNLKQTGVTSVSPCATALLWTNIFCIATSKANAADNQFLIYRIVAVFLVAPTLNTNPDIHCFCLLILNEHIIEVINHHAKHAMLGINQTLRHLTPVN